MLVYKRTFDNIKNVDGNFPIEDQYFASSDEAIVADGITRDPIGCSDLASISQEEFVKKYPNPSGAYLAAKEICNTFSITTGSLYERLIKCNESVKLLNNKYILKCDYLESDYYGAITGEDAVREFIRYGSFNLEKNDIVLVYSDGFTKFLHDGDFVEQIVNFDVLKFEDYVNKKALSDYSKYGKEKTIVMFINKE